MDEDEPYFEEELKEDGDMSVMTYEEDVSGDESSSAAAASQVQTPSEPEDQLYAAYKEKIAKAIAASMAKKAERRLLNLDASAIA